VESCSTRAAVRRDRAGARRARIENYLGFPAGISGQGPGGTGPMCRPQKVSGADMAIPVAVTPFSIGARLFARGFGGSTTGRKVGRRRPPWWRRARALTGGRRSHGLGRIRGPAAVWVLGRRRSKRGCGRQEEIVYRRRAGNSAGQAAVFSRRLRQEGPHAGAREKACTKALSRYPRRPDRRKRPTSKS